MYTWSGSWCKNGHKALFVQPRAMATLSFVIQNIFCMLGTCFSSSQTGCECFQQSRIFPTKQNVSNKLCWWESKAVWSESCLSPWWVFLRHGFSLGVKTAWKPCGNGNHLLHAQWAWNSGQFFHCLNVEARISMSLIGSHVLGAPGMQEIPWGHEYWSITIGNQQNKTKY